MGIMGACQGKWLLDLEKSTEEDAQQLLTATVTPTVSTKDYAVDAL